MSKIKAVIRTVQQGTEYETKVLEFDGKLVSLPSEDQCTHTNSAGTDYGWAKAEVAGRTISLLVYPGQLSAFEPYVGQSITIWEMMDLRQEGKRLYRPGGFVNDFLDDDLFDIVEETSPVPTEA